jgi:hypothetical protein
MVLGAGAGAEWSEVLSACVAGSYKESERVSDCTVVGEHVGVRLGGSGNRAGGGV